MPNAENISACSHSFGISSDNSGPHPPQTCQILLDAVSASDLKRLKIDEDLLARSEGEDRRILMSVIRLVTRFDDALLTRIAYGLIENPKAPSRSAVLSNPYYANHPDAYREFAAVTLATLKDQFSDQFEPYEMGMLSALLPEVPRLNEDEPIEASAMTSNTGKVTGAHRRQMQSLKQAIESDQYRPALLRLFRRLSEDLLFLMECVTLVNAQDPRVVGDKFDAANIQKTLDRLERGSLSDRDAFVLTTMIMNFAGRVGAYGRTMEQPRIRATVMFAGAQKTILFREYNQRYAERYIIEKLRIDSDVAALAFAFSALGSNAPLPVSAKVLRTAILSRGGDMLGPIVRRLRSKIPVPTTIVTTATPTPAPFEFKMRDHFEPVPEGHKRRRAADETKGPSTASVSITNDVPSELDLRPFTSFGTEKRSFDHLMPLTKYQFWYLRDSKPVLRQVRFGTEAVAWFRQNPNEARLIVNALNLGDYLGEMSGIKPLNGRSRRFDGTIYEVKAYGKFRALLIKPQGIWEVVGVFHKDELDRQIEWVKPLPASAD